MRVLVIDDEPEIGKMIFRMLKREDIEVLIANSGKRGLQLIYENPDIDLVITDLIMPEKEGIEIILELKRDFPELKILAMSGGGKVGPQDYLALAKGLGADLTLSKPFLKIELCQAVDKLIGGTS